MKKWAYVSGFVFLAFLLGFTYYRVKNRSMPEGLFYLFVIVAAVFFFILVFAVLKRSKDK